MALWLPSNLSASEQLAWYDANDPSTITTVSSAVSQWNDKFGNGHDISQSVAIQRPNYNIDTVEFDGGDEILWNSNPFLYAAGDMAMYFVGSAPNTETNSAILAEASSTDTNPLYRPIYQHSSQPNSRPSAYLRNDAGSIRLEFVPVVTAFDNTVNLLVAIDSGSEMFSRVDGSAISSLAYTRSGSFTVDRFAMGALKRATELLFMQMDVKEIVLTRELSAADNLRMEGYLAHKWGIAGNLPIGHTYKSEAPMVATGSGVLAQMLQQGLYAT